MKVSLKNMFSKSENKSENLSFITKEIYDNIEECNCGGPVFKYHDVSKNIFIVKCGYHKKILDIDKLTKRKVWIIPKKISCNWLCVCKGERPIFKEINTINTINTILIKQIEQKLKTKNEILEEKLRVLFKFLFVSNHSSTLDEINILVKNCLLKDPKQNLETYEEYHDRIFFKKIIDLSHTIVIKKLDIPIVFFDFSFLKKRNEIKILKKKESKFVIDIIEETELEENDENEEETELEENDRGDSDFEEICEELGEEHGEIIEENFEDPDDYEDECDYYSD